MKATILLLLLQTILMLCILAPAVNAEVRHNAGPSRHGGMGLDLNWYCAQKYGSGWVSMNTDKTANGWRCTKGNQRRGISVRDACQLHYGDTATDRLAAPRGSGDWHCVLGLDLDSYCRNRYGGNVKATKRNPQNPDSWKCQRGGNYLEIDMGAACRQHYGPSAKPVLGRHEDKQAWTCQIR